MQQAAEALRSEDFEDVAPPMPVRVAAAPDDAANVVRPDFARLTFGAHKPQLSAALDAVVRAADTIKAVQERAAAADLQHRALLDDVNARLLEVQQQLDAERARADEAEERLLAVTDRAAERLSEAGALLEAARDEGRVQAERAEAAERRAEQQALEFADRLNEAQDRVFAAETRAIEAREDIVYLENHIRERFGL